MTKENAVRIIIAIEQDEDLKAKFHGIMDKVVGFTQDERDKVIKEELIPFSKGLGYEFSPEDLRVLASPADSALSDEELEKVAGGKAVFSKSQWNWDGGKTTRYYSCAVAPDLQSFLYHLQWGHCPNHGWKLFEHVFRQCGNCSHFSDWEE